MSPRRGLTLLAAGLACAGLGLAAAWLARSAWLGLSVGVAVALGIVVVSDRLKASRTLAWLRSDAEGERPQPTGAWGDVAYQIEKLVRRRERSTQFEQQRLTQFLAAVEASPIGVLLLDAQQKITWCSRLAAVHLGLDSRRDLAQPVTNLVRAPAFVEHLGVAPLPGPVFFEAPGGTRLSALVQPYGNGLKLILTEDITERERAEAMRRNFVANVSHEIRTPLTVLAGFVETMSQLPLSEGERQRVLALMGEQARRMQALVADLLTLAQLEGSPRPVSDQWQDVAVLMERAQAEGTALSAGRHDLHFDSVEEAQIAGNAAELHSALGNLVANAIRYTPKGGRIDVRWRWLDDGGGVFEVGDTGVGIAREHLPRLTERFYRIDSSRSRDTGGTGLGLAIVKHVMQRHGGEIDVRSELGKGSMFRLLLPSSRVRRAQARGEQGAQRS